MFPQHRESAAAHERVGIFERRNDPPDTGCDDALRTRAGAAPVGTWLERAIQCGAARPLTSLLQREDLGVRLASPFVCAVTDDNPTASNDARADDRVRRRAPQTATCMCESSPHPSRVLGGAVTYHFS
jgi:hypothetical protein